MSKYITKYLTPGEEVYATVQQRKALGIWPIFPDVIVMTNRRILFIHPSLTGCRFDDSLWQYVKGMELRDHIFTSTISCVLTDDRKFTMDSLNKDDALRFYKLGQQLEEQMIEHRRQLELDRQRAGASQIHLTPGTPAMSTALPDRPLEVQRPQE